MNKKTIKFIIKQLESLKEETYCKCEECEIDRETINKPIDRAIAELQSLK